MTTTHGASHIPTLISLAEGLDRRVWAPTIEDHIQYYAAELLVHLKGRSHTETVVPANGDPPQYYPQCWFGNKTMREYYSGTLHHKKP